MKHGVWRWFKRGLLALLLLSLLGVGGIFLAAREVQQRLATALGPGASIGAISLHWDHVSIEKLSLAAPADWPVKEQLRAEEVALYPDLRSLLDARLAIRRLHIHRPYLALLRNANGLQVLPGWPPTGAGSRQGSGIPISINEVEFTDASLEFFDASIRQPALRLRIDPVQLRLGNIEFPLQDQRLSLALEGVVQGPQQDGTISLAGWVNPLKRDLQLESRLRGVDVTPFEPYLMKSVHARIRKGLIDLKLEALVENRQLQAPGQLTLTGLSLGEGDDWLGWPRRAVVAALKDHQDAIAVSFELKGNLADPNFRLNDSIALHFASGFAQALGLNRAPAASADGESGPLQAMGNALKRFFGH